MCFDSIAATAGKVTPFSVTIKDSFSNWQPDPSISQSGINIKMSDTFGRSPYVLQVTHSTFVWLAIKEIQLFLYESQIDFFKQAPFEAGDLPAYTDTVSFVGDVTLRGTQVLKSNVLL